MKLFNKKSKNQEEAPEEQPQEPLPRPSARARAQAKAQEEAAAAAAQDQEEEKPKTSILQKVKTLPFALISCVVALVLAAALLYLSGFGIFSILRGPAQVDAVQDQEQGAFVERDVFAVLGIYHDETEDSCYAVVPMGGKLVTVSFTPRYAANVLTVMDQTYQYVSAEITQLDSYVVARGTVSTLSQEQSGLFYQWFADNREDLAARGIISGGSDAAEFISEAMLQVDTVGGMSQTIVMAMTIGAGVLLLVVLAQLVLMAVGFYKKKTPTQEGESPQESENTQAQGESEAAVEPAPQLPDAPEGNKTVVLSENNDTGEN